jgi:hypothetical protein
VKVDIFRLIWGGSCIGQFRPYGLNLPQIRSRDPKIRPKTVPTTTFTTATSEKTTQNSGLITRQSTKSQAINQHKEATKTCLGLEAIDYLRKLRLPRKSTEDFPRYSPESGVQLNNDSGSRQGRVQRASTKCSRKEQRGRRRLYFVCQILRRDVD